MIAINSVNEIQTEQSFENVQMERKRLIRSIRNKIAQLVDTNGEILINKIQIQEEMMKEVDLLYECHSIVDY